MDSGLIYLMELNGEIFPMDNGYWTKFEVKAVEPNDEIPHGIRYSLILHDRSNVRILGYDNAHGIKVKKNRLVANRTAWDHKHQKNRVDYYEFKSAGQLLEDFWNDVNHLISDC